MTFEDLQKANGVVKPTDIGKGKGYVEVNQRVKAFRMLFPMGKIETELISLVDGVCIFKAVVSDENGNVLATGTAYEKENSTFINKTSFIENCETSAVGRALAMCGIGIDLSIASYEEVANAKANQGDSVDYKKKFIDYIAEKKMDSEKVAKILELYGVKKLSEMPDEYCKDYLEKATKREKEKTNE